MIPLPITQPGLYPDMDEATYHADPVASGSLSHSRAKLLLQSAGAARLRYTLDHPQPAKAVFDLGHAAHALVLGTGPELRAIPEQLLASNGAATTTAAKAFVAEARAEGAVPLKPAELDQIEAMALQLCGNDEAMRALDGLHEASAFCPDARTGVWLRCRFDSISPTGIADYKTAVSADPARFARTAYDLGYHLQAVWYTAMAAALGLADDITPFRFVVQEKTPPHLVAVIGLDEAYLGLGLRDMHRAIDMWQTCTATNQWPGYPAGATIISPPPWVVETALDPVAEAELEALLEGQPA